MPRKSIPISTRLSSDDAEFLASWNGSEAATPSEKLRAMIAELRRQQEGVKDYSGALHVASGLIAPTLHGIRTHEHAAGMHSELITRIGDWLPDCLAFMISASAGREQLDREALAEIEGGLADRVMVLMQSILQMAVTPRCPCYDPQVINDRVQPVLELAQVIFSRTSVSSEENGDE